VTPLVLSHAAPDTEGFLRLQSVLTALLEHRALVADLLRARLPRRSRGTPFVVGVEEDSTVSSATQALHLPVPCLGHGLGKPSGVCHRDLLEVVCADQGLPVVTAQANL
jgi:hypothetical protein